MAGGLFGTAAELVAAREPFAVATVVWRRGPSSGHVGDKALIGADGSMRGWLGGACAQPTVVRAALEAMADGRPRLLLLGQPEELDRRAGDGIVTVPMACESEGAMEVYVEPTLPPPQLVVVGRSPAVFRLSALARTLDWDVAVIDDGGDARDHPDPSLVRTSLDFGGLHVGGGSAIVVATQGNYDDLALEAALETAAGYIGLVASVKRAAATLALLRSRGLDEGQLARVVAPAGVDLGPLPNEDIGVAVLADLVSRRAAGRLVGAAPAPLPAAIDPVCGMTVGDPATAKYVSAVGGEVFCFCAAGCKAAFDADPAAFGATT